MKKQKTWALTAAVAAALLAGHPDPTLASSLFSVSGSAGVQRADIRDLGINARGGLLQWISGRPLAGNGSFVAPASMPARVTVLKALEPAIVTRYTPGMVADQSAWTVPDMFAYQVIGKCPIGMPLFPTGDPLLFRDNPRINGGWFPERQAFVGLGLVHPVSNAPDPYHAPGILVTAARPVLMTVLSNGQGQPLVGAEAANAQRQSGGLSSFVLGCGNIGWAAGCTGVYRINPDIAGFQADLNSNMVARMTNGLNVALPAGAGSQAPMECEKNFTDSAENEFYPNSGYALQLKAHFIPPTANYNDANKTIVDERGQQLAVKCWQVASRQQGLLQNVRLQWAGNTQKIEDDVFRAYRLFHPALVDYCAITVPNYHGGTAITTGNLHGSSWGPDFYERFIAPFPRSGAIRYRHPVVAYYLDPKIAGTALLKAHQNAVEAEARYVVRVRKGTLRAMVVHSATLGNKRMADAWLLAFTPTPGQ